MKMIKERSLLKTQFLLFSAAVLILLPLRTWQLLNITEAGTGFYQKTGFSVTLMYAVTAAALLAFFVTSFFHKRSYFYDAEISSRPALGWICVVAAAALLWSAVTSFQHIWGNLGQLGLDSDSQKDLFRNLIKTGILPRLVEAAAAVLSAVFCFLLGTGYAKGTANGGANKLLALFLPIWVIGRIVYRFTRTVSFLNVADLLYELTMLVFLLLTLMAFIQLNARVNNSGMDWKLTAYGFSAALLCLICFVPRFLLTISGKSALLALQSPMELCDLAMALFVLGTIYSRVIIRRAETVAAPVAK